MLLELHMDIKGPPLIIVDYIKKLLRLPKSLAS